MPLGLSVLFWLGPLGIGEALQAYLQSTDTSLSYAAHHHLGLAGAWPAADKCVHASVYTIGIVVRRWGMAGGWRGLAKFP